MDKLHQFGSFLQRSDLDPLFKSLSATQTNWFELQYEILQIVRCSGARSARENIVASALGLVTKSSSLKETVPSTESKHDSLKNANIKKAIDTIRSLNENIENDMWTADIQEEITRYLSVLEDDELMTSWLTSDLLSYSQTVLSSAQSNEVSVLQNIVNYCIEHGGLLRHLILLVAFSQSEDLLIESYNSQIVDTMARRKNDALSFSELSTFAEQLKSLESTKLCEGTPRINIFCGSATKYSRYEIHGAVGASVVGLNQLTALSPPILYFEVTLKSKGGDLSNIRLGWGSQCNTYFSSVSNSGQDDTHWLVDLQSGRIVHDEKSNEIELSAGYDIADLFGADNEDIGGSATAIATEPIEVSTTQTNSSPSIVLLQPYSSNPIRWDSGVISCVYNFPDSTALFFISGEYVGQFSTNHNWTELDKRDLAPIFVGNSSSSFDLNLGQQPYQYLSQVSSYLSRSNIVDMRETDVVSQIEKTCTENLHSLKYLSFNSYADKESGRGFFSVKDVTQDAIKTFTLEMSVRVRSEYDGIDRVVMQTSPLSDGSISNDGSLTLGIGAHNNIFFFITGCGIVETPRDSLPRNLWCHIAVAFSHHKSSGKVQVIIYINGQNSMQLELAPEKNAKSFKISIKHMYFGSPFPTEKRKPFIGDLSNIRLWGNSRGGEKISSLMHKSKLGGHESDLLLFIPCDEGYGIEVHDCSSSRNPARRQERLLLQGDYFWGTMTSENWLVILDSIRSGWNFPSYSNTSVNGIHLLSSVLHRIEIILHKFDEYLVHGWSLSDFKKNGLSLATYLSDHNSVSFELIKSLLITVLRRIATGVESRTQSMFEKMIMLLFTILEKGLQYLQHLPLKESISCCPLKLRTALFMIIIFVSNGCSFLTDQASMTLTGKAQEILSRFLNQFNPNPKERLLLLQIILDHTSKSIDEVRPLGFHRSSSMDGGHNVQAFVKLDFSQALHYLKQETKFSLQSLLLRDASTLSTLSSLITPSLRPRNLAVGSSTTSIKELAKTMTPCKKSLPDHGDFVRRGDDWKYGDEDGSGVGVVLSLARWKEQADAAVIVLWENHHIGKYRCGYRVHSDSGVEVAFDVNVLVDGKSELNCESVEDIDEEYRKKNFRGIPSSGALLKPSSVVASLLSTQDFVNPSISKRTVLTYLQENGDSTWVESNDLMSCINDLVAKFSNFKVCLLFGNFLQYHESHFLPQLNSSVSTEEEAMVENKTLLSLVYSIIRSIENDINHHNDSSMCILALNAVTALLYGAVENGSQSDEIISVSYNPISFGALLNSSDAKWNWNDGDWTNQLISDSDSLKSADFQGKDHLLDTFPISRIPSNIQVRHRGKGLELSVQGDREWSTVVFDSPMLPNTGVYRWYVKVKFSERRGQVLLGLCTDKLTARESQLGVSDQSWGISPSFDIYHGGRKRRLGTDSHKLSSGSILEFVIDTDIGTFQITELGSGSVVYRYGKDSEFCTSEKLRTSVLLPAISLSNPGDSALFVGDAGDIKVVKAKMSANEGNAGSEDKRFPASIFLGCPTAVSLDCFSAQLSFFCRIIEKNLRNIENLANISLDIGSPLMLSLASLKKWGHFAPPSRIQLSRSLLFLIKQLLGARNSVGSYLSTHCEVSQVNAISDNLQQWKMLILQLLALTIELLGKVAVEMARIPTLGSYFNEYLDVGGNVKIESSSSMKSAYSKALASDVLIQGVNETPFALHKSEVVVKWIESFIPDTNFQGCEACVSLLIQSSLFHIGMEKLYLEDEQSRENAMINAIINTLVDQVQLFIRQFRSLSESLQLSVLERMRLVAKCVRSPMQASISLQNDSDGTLVTILKSYADEILSLVFCEHLNCSVLESLILNREQQANCKSDAFELMRSVLLLLEDEQFLPFYTIFLDQIAVALNSPYEIFPGIFRDNSVTSSWHYFDGLNAASLSSAKRLRASFSSLVSHLISNMSNAAGGGADRLVVSLIGVLATKVTVFDHESLARNKFFAALEEIMEDQRSSLHETGALQSNVSSAATKLFIMMALQIASGGKKVSKDRTQPSPIMQRAFTLERMRSGPATLNRSVFDLVYRLLLKAISRSSTAKSESLFECVTILLNVAVDEDSKKIIATPDWVQLLVNVVFSADMKYRQRAMAVLLELIPFMNYNDQEWLTLAPLLSKWEVASFVELKGKDIPLCLILHIIGKFVTIPLSLSTTFSFAENGEKVIDQYQQVMSLVTEGITLYRTLLVSENEWSNASLSFLERLFHCFSLNEGTIAVDESILGALAVYDGYLVCSHLYSMVACPLSGEIFVGVITGYVDSSKERVEASGILVSGETVNWKYDRKQDLKKMVAGASVLLPIQKFLPCMLPVSNSLIFGAMKVFSLIDCWYTSRSSKFSKPPAISETKLETEVIETKEDETAEYLPSFCVGSFEFFRSAFAKFLSCILTHPSVSGEFLLDIAHTEEFRYVWESSMQSASQTCRASDMGMFSNLEEHFHDLAVMIGNKKLQLQQKGSASSVAVVSDTLTNVDKSAAPFTPSSTIEPRTPIPEDIIPDVGVPPVLVDSLTSMGFPRPLCITALQRCGGDFEEALNFLLNSGGIDAEEEIGYNMTLEDDSAAQQPPTDAEVKKTTSVDDHEVEEEEEEEVEKFEYHYKSRPGKALPFHIQPSLNSERMGCLFPGDDIHVVVEREIDGVKWLQFHMSDFDGSHYASSYGEEFYQFMVWVPSIVNGEQVIHEGLFQNDIDTEFSEVIFDAVPIDRCYRVTGSNGMLVRVGIEIGTDEVATLDTGTFVHACEESFNTEGTVRLFIDQPVRGWVSKLLELVERVPSSMVKQTNVSNNCQKSIDVNFSEYDIQIEDNMDSSSGHDIFTKEDRFFANMQGRRFEFLERAEGSKLLNSTRRRKLLLPSSSTSTVAELQTLLLKTLSDIGSLMLRKCLVLVVCHLTSTSQKDTNTSYDLLNFYSDNSSAETLMKCIRLLLFRGDLSYMDGIQRFLFSGGDYLTVLKQPVSLEDSLVILADRIVSKKLFHLSSEMESKFQQLFVIVIQKSIVQACDSRYSDHSWEDSTNEATADSDVLSSPSINYALWLTIVLTMSKDEETLMKLVVTWVQAVKASSMSLKCIAYRVSSHLLELARNLSASTRSSIHIHTKKMVSLRRLSLFAVKRLWQEMEDAPQYSRFMQALTALLFQITDVFGSTPAVLDSPALCNSTGQMMTLNRSDSHVQFASQKDLSSPWSLRIRLRRRKFIPEQYEPYLQSEKDAKSIAVSTPNARKTFADLIKLLTGDGMEERMNSVEQSGSQGSSLKSTKLIPGEYYLNPSYLLFSSRAFIKIQKGGRKFVDQTLDDDLATSEPVNDEALCFSLGGQGFSEERVFDVVLPYDKWLDLMVVCDQNAGTTSLYVDGQFQDSASFTMNLPLTTLGSPKSGLSFAGDISHFQVWNYAKSMMELTKDCCATVSLTNDVHKSQVGNKPLINLVYSAESLDGLFDEMGTITGLKSNKCTFPNSEDVKGGPSLSMLVPPTVNGDSSSLSPFLVTASNIETPDFVELTGYVRVPKSGKKLPLSNGIEEIIVLQYRVDSPFDSTGSEQAVMYGFLTWSNHQVKIEMKGSQNVSSKKFVLQGNGADVINGPPEKISWLRCITFTGEIKDGSFIGDCEVDLKLDVSLSQSPGSARLDLSSLPSAIEASCAGTASSVKDVIKVKNGFDDGQFIAYCAVQPYIVGEYLSYGMMKDQGSLWIDWYIKASSGNIAFGWTKHSALTHPDASVDANQGTWTYSTSGQASHGADLYLCDSADEGDIISFQINTHLGRIRIFKNYELFLVFENICEDSMMSLRGHQLIEVDQLGIRPFVSLVSPGDCVQLLGVKDSAIEITFPESDAYTRCKFVGSLVNGNIDGYGLVGKDTNSRWEFGVWKEDEAMHIHIEIADILAEEIEVKEVRRYLHNELIPLLPNEDITITVQQLIQQFYLFRSYHLSRGCSLFAESSQSVEAVPDGSLSQESASAVESNDAATGSVMSVRVSAHAYDIVPFAVPMGKPLGSMLDSFAARNDAYREAFVFKLGEKEITAVDTPESAGLTEGCCITATTKSFTYDESIDDPVSHYFPQSTAPYIVMIIYEGGATVRNRIEIDDNSLSLRIIRKGEIVEAFRKTMTSDGIGRFKISDGWISERLRGGTEEPVVRILKQRFQLTSKQELQDLPHYRVLREEGAKLRAGASFQSEDLGFCAQNTICYVDEKRMARNEAESNAWTSRIHICSPPSVSGWISDKDRLIEKVSDGAFASVDPAIQIELARRNKLRAMKRSNAMLGRHTNHQVQLVKINAEVSLSTDLPFLLKKSRHCENLLISKDFTTVTCPEGGGGRQIVLGSKGFAHGIHYWEVHVKAANWGTVFIGVAPEEASGWSGLGFINYRATQAFGSETLYGNYYGVNDKIGVLLDMDRGTLTFFKDGEDFNVGRVTVANMGVAYRNVRKSASRHSSSTTLYPCFGVKTSGDSLSIKDTHWMSYSGLDSTQSMQRAMQALSFVHAWKDSYASNRLSISPACLKVMYEDYGQKCSPNFFTTDARPGLPVQLLVSHDALLKALGDSLVTEFGLHIGCNLSTVYGPASLLGVSFLPYDASCRVWYSCDKNGKRAWYWTVSELQSELQAHRISVLSELLIPISHRQESFNAIDQDIRLSQDALDRLLGANVLPTSSSFPSASTTPTTASAAFSGAADATREVDVLPWTYLEDCQLTDAVNQVAILHDHDACTLSAHMVQRYLEQQQLLSHRTPTEIHVRYTALCLLNRCIAIALPLLDLSLADMHKSLLVPTVSSSNSSGLAYGRNLQSIPSPLRDMVLSVKQVIFTQTKMQFWTFAVRETTVSTALPADEYERPDEIREITINSLKGKHFRSGLPTEIQQWEQQELMFERIAHHASLANSGTNSTSGTSATSSTAATTTTTSTTVANLLSDWVRDMDERLKLSVFGQLLEAFNGWDDRVLRKAYVHMQDAGQARAFFVKLAGEGVDDQGGPYRAVFQQAIGEEITHLFPLLAPTDNHVQGIGQQRDKFNFNLALLSHHPKGVSLLVHLGKLVGVAVRHRIQVPLPLTTWLYQTLCFESVSPTESMTQSHLSLVNSLRSLSEILKDVNGEVFEQEEREEAAEFLVEALLKIVKKLQTTSRAVWTSLMTSAISSSGNSVISNTGSGSGGSSGGGNSSGASFASLTMNLSDISEEKLRGMVGMAAGLRPQSVRSTVPSSASSIAVSSSLSEGNAFTSVQEIIDAIFFFHLLAQNEALQLFFKGLAQILPVELFSLFTKKELETLISGTQKVNLDVLQQATVYEDVSHSDSHVQMFWEALHSLSHHEQSLFVNFCSGRSRLPASASDFPMPFKITTAPPSAQEHPDRFLPVARTCFFTLSLPKYSSVDVCREKLQYAIRHTEVMDADFVDRRGASAWDQLPAAPPLPFTSATLASSTTATTAVEEDEFQGSAGGSTASASEFTPTAFLAETGTTVATVTPHLPPTENDTH